MNKQARCPGCHRLHKRSHDLRVVIGKPYQPGCRAYVNLRVPSTMRQGLLQSEATPA